MKKKKAILSYDYELFFGDRSGTVQKSLIDPTNSLLDAMDAVGLKGNFFVDWQMIKYLKEANTERTTNDLILIENQLKDIIRRGHRIELHIHPHWVDAKYNGDGTWNFDEFRHYSLNSFNEAEIIEMFVDGVELLTLIAKEVDPEYKLVAFRAGGWAVQPFTVLKKAFQKTGIVIDSSVMPGLSAVLEHSYYDFTQAPNEDVGYYRFNDDVCIKSNSGEFVEVPISSTPHRFINRVVNKCYSLRGIKYQVKTDGTHTRLCESIQEKHQSNKSIIPYTISSITPINCLLYLLYDKRDMLCYIDHPKDYSNFTIKGIHYISKFAKSITYKDLLCYV